MILLSVWRPQSRIAESVKRTEVRDRSFECFFEISYKIKYSLTVLFVIAIISFIQGSHYYCCNWDFKLLLIIIIIARFYSLTNVAKLLLRSDSNSYSLLVGSVCLRKQTDVRHAAAWKWLDLNPGPPDTKQPLYHLCYLFFDPIFLKLRSCNKSIFY